MEEITGARENMSEISGLLFLGILKKGCWIIAASNFAILKNKYCVDAKG